MEDIRSVPLFAQLSQKQLRLLSKHTDEVTVSKGYVFAHEERGGGRELLVVVEGKLTVERAGKQLATLGPGDVVGEMSLIDGKPYSATVSATTDATVLVIGGRSFRQLLDELPSMRDGIMRVLVQRLRLADERLTL
jgi:CRP-like cAMP-binding protein